MQGNAWKCLLFVKYSSKLWKCLYDKVAFGQGPDLKASNGRCISVNETVLNRAIGRWQKETYRLFEKLLDLYGSRHISLEVNR